MGFIELAEGGSYVQVFALLSDTISYMLPIIGIVIVFGSIITGYLLEGGNIHVLFQPAGFMIIGGAAIGSLILTCPPKLLLKILAGFPSILKAGKLDKEAYLSLLSLLHRVFMKIRRKGLLAIEKDLEAPEKSSLFSEYPEVLKNRHAISFLCDNLRIFVIGVKPMDIEEIMEVEMEAHLEESNVPPIVILKLADSLPGFGIVAAVLGVIITMGKMSGSPETIGHSIAAALVGTFLGILLCYGFFAPIGNHMEHKVREEFKYIEVVKVSIISFLKDLPPQMAVEAGRRVVPGDAKPTFTELENRIVTKRIRKKAA